MNKLLILPTTCTHQVYIDAFKKCILMGIIEGYEYKVPDRAQDKVAKLLRIDDGQSQGGHSMMGLMMMSANMYGVEPYSKMLNYFKLEGGADKMIMKCIEENNK